MLSLLKYTTQDKKSNQNRYYPIIFPIIQQSTITTKTRDKGTRK